MGPSSPTAPVISSTRANRRARVVGRKPCSARRHTHTVTATATAGTATATAGLLGRAHFGQEPSPSASAEGAGARSRTRDPNRPRREPTSGEGEARTGRPGAACRPEDGSSGRKGRIVAHLRKYPRARSRVRQGSGIAPRSSQGAHIVIQRCPSGVESGPRGDVSSGPCDSREQSYARGTAQWRGLRGAGSSRSVPWASPGRGRRHPAPVRARRRSGRRSDRTFRHSVHPRIGRSPGVHRVPAMIQGGMEASGPSGRRRTTPESSCGTPMHAASLTKGYGGNPPSGRSVSPPPRTGPFFCPASRTLLRPPGPGAPVTRSSPVRRPGAWHGGARSRA